MPDKIDIRVTAALHPGTFDGLEGVDDSTSTFIAPAVEAFDAAYRYIGSIHDVRAAAFADPTLTDEAALLKTDDFAAKGLAGVTKRIDSAIAQLGRSIAHYEGEMRAPVKAQASLMISGEVRAAMKQADNRLDLLNQALTEGDQEVLSAVLGGPPMLSGLTKEMHAVYLRRYNEQRDPVKAQRLRAMTAARDRLQNQGGLVLTEMIKAIGGIPVTDKRTGFVIRSDGPETIRKKRDASAATYARYA